jgi:hypothetical protein
MALNDQVSGTSRSLVDMAVNAYMRACRTDQIGTTTFLLTPNVLAGPNPNRLDPKNTVPQSVNKIRYYIKKFIFKKKSILCHVM